MCVSQCHFWSALTAQEGTGHEGTKPSRVVFCGKTNRLFTTGFSKMSERQFALWDPVCLSTFACPPKLTFCTVQESLSAPLTKENIDNGSGVLFPFWDEGTHMVYLVGKVCRNCVQFHYEWCVCGVGRPTAALLRSEYRQVTLCLLLDLVHCSTTQPLSMCHAQEVSGCDEM